MTNYSQEVGDEIGMASVANLKRVRKRAQDARYRETHKIEIKKYKDAWYLRHTEHVKSKSKKWGLEHPEKMKARQTQWRKNHAEEERVRHEKYRREHRETIRIKSAEYRKSRAHLCPDCYRLIDYGASRCRSCAKKGELHPQWKGGRITTGNGYYSVLLPGHPMANKYGYVDEHRLVMASLIGRPNIENHALTYARIAIV
jgi:hypothetical protein